jgi:hypothetical protein
MGRNAVCIAKRAQALALLEFGHSVLDIHIHTGLGMQTIYNIRARAIDRGYHPVTNKEFTDALFEDSPRSGPPTLMSEEVLGKPYKYHLKINTNINIRRFTFACQLR